MSANIGDIEQCADAERRINGHLDCVARLIPRIGNEAVELRVLLLCDLRRRHGPQGLDGVGDLA